MAGTRRPPGPGLFHSTDPAWNDRNLQELSALAWSGRVFAHIRASTGTAVQQTNCHPFRYDRWLWMHNGLINDFSRIKRDLTLAVDPTLFPLIEGSTDSELFFYLALTFGLENDPPRAVAQAVGTIEAISGKHDVEYPMQMTVATTDGETTWAFRYSSEGKSRSLFRSTDISALRALHPTLELLQGLSADARLVVSEPLGDLEGAWQEVLRLPLWWCRGHWPKSSPSRRLRELAHRTPGGVRRRALVARKRTTSKAAHTDRTGSRTRRSVPSA